MAVQGYCAFPGIINNVKNIVLSQNKKVDLQNHLKPPLMNEPIVLVICGIAGVLFQCLFKLDSLAKLSRAGNVPFNWKKDYLQKDSVAIMLAFLSVVIWYLIFGEVSAKYSWIAGLKRVSFVLMGAIGSFVIQFALGKAKDAIIKVIDVKTNVADKVTGGSSTVHETIQKAQDAGIDVTSTPKP